MKKTRKKLYVILALVVLLSIVLLGYTFSKYKQSVEVSTTSTVAKWSFVGSVENSEKSSTETTISLADTVNSTTIKSQRIAPGTSGQFDIVIDATGSEVNLDYDVAIKEESSKPQNLYFTYKGTKYTTLKSLIEKVNEDGTKEFAGTINHNDANKTVTYSISWDWPYETTINNVLQDDKDVEDAIKDVSNYVFTLVINGTQVN